MTQQLQRSFEGFDYYDEMQVQKVTSSGLNLRPAAPAVNRVCAAFTRRRSPTLCANSLSGLGTLRVAHGIRTPPMLHCEPGLC